ncbi:hypothetical protein F4678DRAFT_461059 [Xylaria arbuscula]|nr:hypothetical protein F4678DRAFT_461059 [Xylaria arbuscula]
MLDVNELPGIREYRVRDFATIPKENLKMICEIARINNDPWVSYIRSIASRVAIPMSEDRYFCRTWLINVLEALHDNGVVLHDKPGYIQRAVEINNEELRMCFGSAYYVLVPI